MATEPERLFSDLIGALRPKGDRWRGCLMGDFTGNTDAPIAGWKYVRIPIAGTGDYSLGMFPVGGAGGTEYNTPVLIEYDPINHQRIIAGIDAQAAGATIGGPTIPDPGGFSLPMHAWTHQLGGNDQLVIAREQLGNLQISPSTTAGHVTVSGGVCVIDGVLIKVYLPIDVDLTAYYPATGVKYVWLTLTAAGAVAVIDPAVTDITALAWPSTNNHVLGFVMLKALLTTINWSAIKSVFDVIKSVTSHLPAATAQYQVITSGANPFPATWSDFFIQGSATRTYTFPNVTGAVALGAGTLTNATANDATIANHLHAITASATPGAAESLLKTAADGQLTLDSLVVGTELGANVPANHQMQIVTTGTKTPLLIEGGSDTIEIWKDVLPSYAVAIGMSPPGGGVTNDIIFSTYVNLGAWIEHMRITNYLGNVKVGGTAIRAGADGSKHLDIFDGVPPSGALTNGISLYNASGKFRVMDAAGSSIGFDGGGASCTLTLPNAATSITGGGTLALGTFTLTIPESMTAAGRNVANTFTAVQTINLNAAALQAPPTGTIFHLGNANDASAIITLDSYGTGVESDYYFRRAMNTAASPQTIDAARTLGTMIGQGYDGAAYATAASIAFRTEAAWDGTHHAGQIRFLTTSGVTTALAATIDSAKALTVVGAFGCNAATAQTAYASGGALAAYVTGAFGLNSDANMSALHAMVVKIRAALVANGIMS